MYESTKLNTQTASTPVNCVPKVVSGFEIGTTIVPKIPANMWTGIAIPVHMFAGIFGTMVVPISNPDTTFGTQFTGVLAVCVFSFVLSYIVFRALKQTIGLRISAQAEKLGTDVAEVGVKAYAIRD